MIDLYNNIYNRQILKNNIYAVKLIDILKTQKLDISFIVNYILNKKYQIHEDDKITIPIVLKYQTHIKPVELIFALMNYDSDNDSIDDFETISNKV
jgi:hypothetical protein